MLNRLFCSADMCVIRRVSVLLGSVLGKVCDDSTVFSWGWVGDVEPNGPEKLTVRLVLSGPWIWMGESFSVLGMRSGGPCVRREVTVELWEELIWEDMGVCSGARDTMSAGGHEGCWDTCGPPRPADMPLVDVEMGEVDLWPFDPTNGASKPSAGFRS